MKRLNSAYRGIHKTTDVLSFPIYDTAKEVPSDRWFLLGDIVINPRAVKRQSVRYGATFDEEMRRLLIHGFLHLLGYDHERNRYQAGKMRKEERKLQHALETLA
jgi:probable rRNA maturation factor